MKNPYRRDQRLAEVRARYDALRMPFSIAALHMSKDVNIGGLIRAANAFLMREVIYIGERTYDDSASAAVGANRIETILHFPDEPAFLAWLDETQRPLVCIEQADDAVALCEATIPDNAVFLLGQELYGTPPALLDRAALCIEIPQFGAVGSLNVTMAATLVMHELAERHFLHRPPHTLAPDAPFTPGGKPKRNAAEVQGRAPVRR